ncbi:endonuclease/exonuclease/phosphatase family protein [Clostridium chrysemydis]|uniref:endonuclease/exonuclease/phosphatase family protein n=1 Tax=Clostridium chrysemydis TaxID=2665504 RepID=UPI001883F382|nr:endonuclease/exonuclease/phosphatase family protein [Clostridium chrysemydis]
MKKMIKVLIYAIIVLLVLVLGYVCFMIVTDYKPEPIEKVNIENNREKTVKLNKEYTLTTFNIGYAGMDKNVDFFMDGGKMSRAISEEAVKANLNGIENIMKDKNSDFYFLQEIDKKASRSFNVNEVESVNNNFKDYSTSFAKNFDVKWVPLPITHPHGRVLSGIMTLSKYSFNSADRYDLPGKESYFRQLGDLDRCMLVNREKLENGKEFVLINVHLSAFDKGGKVRKVQLAFIKKFVLEEYNKGNYVILGGDFNNQLPGTDAFNFKTTEGLPDWIQKLPEDFTPKGFSIYSDKFTPSNRTVEKPYVDGENLKSVIDGFLVSDNIKVKSIKGKDYNFEYSDHNPTTLTFELK